MAEKRIWILNLDEIDDVIFSLDAEINLAARAAYRAHCIGGGVTMMEPPPYYADAAAYAIARGFEPVIMMSPLVINSGAVFDWLAEISIHSPRHRRAILSRRMSYAQMLAAADRWHDAQRRAAERLRNRAIERDDVGAPTVMELDGEWSGWRWVWLRSDEARDAEGRAMGNCVGGGYYDDLSENAGVFSLRDPRGEPHVTAELNGDAVLQAECRGGADVSERFRGLVDRMVAVIGVRLLINGDPTIEIADGEHAVDGILAGDREIYHVADGVLHRIGGPACISELSATYYDRGVETRRILVNHEVRGAVYYSCRMADDIVQLRRCDSYYAVDTRYRIETLVDIDGNPLDERAAWTTGSMYTVGDEVHDARGNMNVCVHRVPPAINANQEIRP